MISEFASHRKGVDMFLPHRRQQHLQGQGTIRLAGVIAAIILSCTNVIGQTNYQQLMVFGSPHLAGFGGIRPLIWAGPSLLYGTTARGVAGNNSFLFSVRSDGLEHDVWHSVGTGDNAVSAGLVLDVDGTIYGMNSGLAFKWGKQGYVDQTKFLPKFIAFGGSWALGTNGALFGTAAGGGSNGFGAVFRINVDGSGLQIVHDFAGHPADGSEPASGVILGSDGMLYGNTRRGGTNDAGTIFRVNIDGSGYQVLRSFYGSDPAWPENALTQGSDGEIYGTAYAGGGFGNFGAIFKLGTDGSGFTLIHSFPVDADHPQLFPSAVVQGPDGALYGTTQYGGITNSVYTNGMGTVFKINTDGSGYTEFYNFSGEDGRQPKSSLLFGSDGTLYGTTGYGGFFDQGTVFKLSNTPTESVALIDYYPTSGALAFTFSAAPARALVFQFSADLGKADGWRTVTTLQTDAFGLAHVTDSSGGGFYRAVLP
jgi:uncharacterized repeat protein (TIGR03803 family)